MIFLLLLLTAATALSPISTIDVTARLTPGEWTASLLVNSIAEDEINDTSIPPAPIALTLLLGISSESFLYVLRWGSTHVTLSDNMHRWVLTSQTTDWSMPNVFFLTMCNNTLTLANERWTHSVNVTHGSLSTIDMVQLVPYPPLIVNLVSGFTPYCPLTSSFGDTLPSYTKYTLDSVKLLLLACIGTGLVVGGAVVGILCKLCHNTRVHHYQHV